MAGLVRVLGIDPGLTRCGVGVVDVAQNRSAVYVHAGVIRTDPDLPLEQRLLAIARGIDAILDEYAPAAVAVERVFAQHNVRTVMGYGAADKRQVTTMVTRILRLDAPPKPADAADALALALCHAWRGGVGAVAGGAGARAGAGARVAGTAATTSVTLTPAQRAWAEAERRAR